MKSLRKPIQETEIAPAAQPSQTAPAAARGVVTIGRSYGAGGRSVGKLVAQRLGVPYYDSELLEQAAVSSGLSRKYLESVDEKSAKLGALYRYPGFDFNPGAALERSAAQAQREIIQRVAQEGSCVIVGRRADQILKGHGELFRVFVTAPVEARAERVSRRENLSLSDSEQLVKKVDRERASYYNQYGGQSWGDAGTYDLCVDTDRLGLEGAAALIVAAVQNLHTANAGDVRTETPA
ncbi:MAG: cytidylate kinase-like family protein [Oscillospiraceae bacterium]|nr:cytidylate kinase-like family protein [Oscillospiraceae bacterium]